MSGVWHGLSAGGVAAPRLGAPLRSARVRRRIRFGVLFILVAGAIAGLVEVLPGSPGINAPISTTPAQVVPIETPAPPDPAAKAVARKFIETAVLRERTSTGPTTTSVRT